MKKYRLPPTPDHPHGSFTSAETPQLISPMVKMTRALIDQYLVFARTNRGPFSDANLDTIAHEMKVGEGGEFPAILLRVNGRVLDPPVYLAGTLDGLERRKADGTLWISEYKTCRDIEERMKLLQHDEQATTYCYMAQELFGERIHGVIYTLLRKKVPRVPKPLANGYLSQRKDIDTTYATYKAAIYRQHGQVSDQFIKRHYGDMLDYLANFSEPYVARVAIERTQAQIDRFITELHQTALEMYDPRTPLYANRTWACPGCHFRQPCLSMDRGEDRQMRMLLKYEYRKREEIEPIPLVDEDTVERARQ
jgi:hypothetical protein